MDLLDFKHVAVVWFVCLVASVAGATQGRAADGKDGAAEQEAIRESKGGALQTSGTQNKTDDQEGQAACRADATQAKVEPVLLLIGSH